MEQHGDKLDDHDGKEKEHEDYTDRLQVEIFLGDQHLNEHYSVKYLLINCH